MDKDQLKQLAQQAYDTVIYSQSQRLEDYREFTSIDTNYKPAKDYASKIQAVKQSIEHFCSTGDNSKMLWYGDDLIQTLSL